jgi:putative transport protein
VSAFLDLLAASPLLLLFVVVGLGYFVGSVKLFGFSLGPAAVLFAGLFFGAVDSRLRIPDIIYILGLILFVYTIGLQSGPTFFTSFGKRTLRANVYAFGVILLAAVLSVLAASALGLRGPAIAGVFCGALTNTPALAASIETVKASLQGLGGAAGTGREIVSAPVIGYSVSYPFGVIGVLIGFYLMMRLPHKPAQGDATTELGDEEDQKRISSRTFRIVNPGIVGKSVKGFLEDERHLGLVLSRLRRENETSIVYPDDFFHKDDLVVAVGDDRALDRARELFGEEASEQIQFEKQVFDYRRIEVSNKAVIGRTVSDLRLQENLDATVTRVRRGDVDFVPTMNTVVERGDRIRVLTWFGNIDRVTKFFGDSVRTASEADFFSVSLGIVLGVLAGMVPLPLPGGSSFQLGFAGGPLVVGLILGRLQRTGKIVWGMPYSANLVLRQVGLVLFLAGIGTKAGEGFVATMAAGGWELMIFGAVVTSVTTLFTLAVVSRTLKMSVPATMGMMSGIQTQPACLAYANEHSSSNAANVWYAAVYPVSMISKIILAQVLVRLTL